MVFLLVHVVHEKLVCDCRMMNHGWDLAQLDAVLPYQPKESMELQ